MCHCDMRLWLLSDLTAIKPQHPSPCQCSYHRLTNEQATDIYFERRDERKRGGGCFVWFQNHRILQKSCVSVLPRKIKKRVTFIFTEGLCKSSTDRQEEGEDKQREGGTFEEDSWLIPQLITHPQRVTICMKIQN